VGGHREADVEGEGLVGFADVVVDEERGAGELDLAVVGGFLEGGEEAVYRLVDVGEGGAGRAVEVGDGGEGLDVHGPDDVFGGGGGRGGGRPGGGRSAVLGEQVRGDKQGNTGGG